MSKSASRKVKSGSVSTRKSRARSSAATLNADIPAGLSRHVQRVIRASRHGGLIQRRGY